MKHLKTKLVLFLIVAMLMLILPSNKSNFNYFNYENATYFFYISGVSNESIFAHKNVDYVKCGDSYIISCEAKATSVVESLDTNILGESVRIKEYSSSVLNGILNKYLDMVVKCENIDDMKILYCYDKSLDRSVDLFDKKVNVQIVIRSNQIDIGYPLILNGF